MLVSTIHEMFSQQDFWWLPAKLPFLEISQNATVFLLRREKRVEGEESKHFLFIYTEFLHKVIFCPALLLRKQKNPASTFLAKYSSHIFWVCMCPDIFPSAATIVGYYYFFEYVCGLVVLKDSLMEILNTSSERIKVRDIMWGYIMWSP